MRKASPALLIMALATLAGCGTTYHFWDTAQMSTSAANVRFEYQSGSESKVAGLVSSARIVSLREIVRKISDQAGQRVDVVEVSDWDEINAVAGVDKQGRASLIFTIRMLNILPSDESVIAALAAHEIAHLARSDGQPGQDSADKLSTVRSMIGAVVVGRVVPSARTLDRERDADDLAMRYAYQAGYDPEGAVRLFRFLQSSEKGSSIPFLASHPVTDERIENMKAGAAELKKPPKAR